MSIQPLKGSAISSATPSQATQKLYLMIVPSIISSRAIKHWVLALKSNKRQSRATFASECGTINGRMMSTSIYQVTCQLSTPLHDEPLQFILAHRDTGDVKNDHHEATDALILVIGAWSAELNEEICL